ncbi:hypothetical protein [Crateriforma conspicua]|uniref:Lipoprotein n=1 Tax=Crateriforma conspicua TaxID=2527996 RepID=A0A5C6FT01_9PLAN|nr:hypothetical protein [Crateriforma conspicua]TWU66117.1 hypothetical protein V7x_16740 [Crateriforma conspicua]
MKKKSRPIVAVALLVGGCTTMTGCASLTAKQDTGRPTTANASKTDETLWEKLPLIGKKDDQPKPYPNPVQVAATWTPDTLMQTGRVPTRGFGGRIFFFDEKSHAVPVEGTLVVHAFNEDATDPKEQVKRYEFTPEQFTKHYSQSDLGASYSVWIPFDAVGGEQRKISLVASFVTESGKPIQSSPAKVVLPGQVEKTQETLAQRFAPEYKDWQAANAGGTTRASGLTTTTIQRRRSVPGSTKIGGATESRSMLASSDATPASDVSMRRRPMTQSVDVMPASATMPSNQTQR